MFEGQKHIVEKCEDPIREMYNIGKVIGLGNLGEIRKCKNTKTQESRCVKVFSKRLCTKQHLKRIYYEIEIMKQLDHPNLCKIFEWFEDSERIYII